MSEDMDGEVDLMPWFETEDNNPIRKGNHYTEHYRVPCFAMDGESVDYAIEQKKFHTKEREIYLAYQKEFQKEDRTIAKFFALEAVDQMKWYRGYCYALSIIAANPPGDCKKQISKEIAPYADKAFGMIDLATVST